MKTYVTAGALLSLLLVSGCADRGDKTAQNADENKAPAAAPPAAAPPAAAAPTTAAPTTAAPESAAEKDAPRAGATENPRATVGRRKSASPTSASGSAAARTQSAPRATAAPTTAAPTTAAPTTAAPTNAAAARRGPEFREVTIPSGTALPLELETALSSETAQLETPVRARLKQAIVVDGLTALPAGATVSGEVTNVQRAGRVQGRSSLAFTFSQIRADNLSAPIKTAPLSYAGEASKGEDATKIGAGAGVGAIVGGIVGGGKGAAKGAAIGGAAGTGVVLATRGKEVELPSGTDLAATLAAPVRIRVPLR